MQNQIRMHGARAQSDAQGSQAAFRAHAVAVARFVARMGVPQADIEDTVQEVFLSAHDKGGYRPGPASERTWYLRLAWYAVTADRRRRKRAATTLQPADEPSADATQQRAVEAKEGLHRVQAALATLSDAHSAALILFDVEGYSATEIAETLEVPVGTVHSRVHIARKRFAAALEAQS